MGWNLGELSQLKKAYSREKDPKTGRMIKWQGVLVSTLIDRVLETLPVEHRAQVDLIVIKGANGEKALIPRALLSKYPLLIAYDWDLNRSPAEDQRGPLYSVVPWSSKPKILDEDLPIEKYFISQVNQIELTNYRDQFSTLFLKRRTDPSAMRGEKLFVQNCTSCHSMNRGGIGSVGLTDERKAQKFASDGHPPVGVALRLSERDRQSIMRYLNAHRTENPSTELNSENFIKSALHH
jgi:hypothetical protein